MNPVVQNFHDPQWVTADIQFRRRDGSAEHRLWIVNRSSEKGYYHEETSITSVKCGMIALGLPFFALFKLMCYVARAVVLPLSILGRSISNLGSDGSWKNFKQLIIDMIFEIPAAIIECIWSIVKTPICFIGMEFSVLCGTVCPLTWRANLADIEGFWCSTLAANFSGKNYTRRYDFKNKDYSERIGDFFTNRKSPYCFHMAYCFQPWGSLNDPHIIRPYQILVPNC